MGKFKVGDKVKVTTERYGKYQHGLVGKVYYNNYPGGSGVLPIGVRFADHTNSYADKDLALLADDPYLPEPEFDLDEIERAERLVHGD